ncbi:MAG TPA: hypothetical protein VNN62_19235 [Methylomirabilota bacterium]|nr:hypothetical protein [Methylomirabilota bacterium]
MPQKEPRIESQVMTSSGDAMKKIERFLRLLTWQMFFLLAILLYLALRPQAGRYQFTVVGDDVGVFDTSNSQAWMIKLQKKSVTPGEQLGSGAAPTGEGQATGEGKQ